MTTTKAAHTPGPWQVGCEYGLQKLEIANADYSKAIATVWAKQSKVRREDGRQYYEADPEGEANCRLIAAAPELLKQLQRIDHTLSVHGKVDADTVLHVALRAAISKATGQGGTI